MVNLYRMRQLIRQTVKVQWKLEQEEARATKTTAILTGMPRGGSKHNQVQDGAIKISELKEVYSEVLTELEQMRKELDPLISDLANPDDRAVMRLRYIRSCSPEDIAEAINRTDRSVYYYLSRAEHEIVKLHPDIVKM